MALRLGGDAARRAWRHLVHVEGEREGRAGLRAERRAEVVHLLAQGLRPADAPLVRRLLEQETAALRAAGHGASEILYTLVAALARFGQPEDALLIWRAREATLEAREGVDVEQLVRAGVEPARHWLRAVVQAGEAEAREASGALAWLEAGAAAGAFDDLAAYFAWADERFGLHVSGPT